jgi:hypothetical protein
VNICNETIEKYSKTKRKIEESLKIIIIALEKMMEAV